MATDCFDNIDDIFDYIQSLQDNIDKLSYIAQLADNSYAGKNTPLLENTLSICNSMESKLSPDFEITYFHFIKANIYSYLALAQNNYDYKDCAFHSVYIEQEIFHLRSAIASPGFAMLNDVQPELVYKILTNYANLLNFIGRPIEAIEHWNKILEIDLNFSMAECNLALGLHSYGRSLYDEAHKFYFLARSRQLYESALNGDLTPEARAGSKIELEQLKKSASTEILSDLCQEYSLGKTSEETSYRQWALKNVLFLNPLNDLCRNPIASTDAFHLPGMIGDTGELSKLSFLAFYNLIKQEFVTARYTYFEAVYMNLYEPHYSDKDVLQFTASSDFPILNIGTEKIKYCFRALFSIFDKIAYFLNSYLKLGIPDNKVYFSNVWFFRGDKKGELHNKIRYSDNHFLKGLFWLYKDLYQSNWNKNSFITDPDTEKITLIRNYLEHKFLKIRHEDSLNDNEPYRDQLSLCITIREFERISLKLLKLVRAAIMYLSMFVKIEEDKLRNKIAPHKLSRIDLYTIDDSLKIKP